MKPWQLYHKHIQDSKVTSGIYFLFFLLKTFSSSKEDSLAKFEVSDGVLLVRGAILYNILWGLFYIVQFKLFFINVF